MIWKIFEIHYDYLMLDETRIDKPSYMSVSQWLDWCNVAREPVDEDEIREQEYKKINEIEEEAYDRGYDAGYEQGIKDA